MGDAQAWFDQARFGMFIHWGFISQKGIELSWPLVGGVGAVPKSAKVGVEDYYSSAPDFFPESGAADRWAQLAAAAGMRYGVLTTKHHDGFCLWPSGHSPLSIAATRYRGDLVAEYVEAFRRADLRVGLYFSLSDWRHPDYPPFEESDKPYRIGTHRRPEPAAWERFVADMHGQIRELLTNYGRIDLLWFDGGWERSPDEWRAAELEAMIRELQPDILVNDRLPGVGDITTPEQFVPPAPLPGRWETCMTMNGTWAYCPDDDDYKTPRDIIHTLVETVSRGGNLLLNVSPGPDGALPPQQIQRLEALARFMDDHAPSIQGCGPGLEPWQVYGASTRNAQATYVHLLLRPYDTVTIRGLPVRRVSSVRHLATGRELSFAPRISVIDAMFNSDPVGEIRVEVPPDIIGEYTTTLELRIT